MSNRDISRAEHQLDFWTHWLVRLMLVPMVLSITAFFTLGTYYQHASEARVANIGLHIDLLVKHADSTLVNASQTLNMVRHMAIKANDATDAQIKMFQAESEDLRRATEKANVMLASLNEASNSLNTLVKHTDRSMNEQVFPAVTAAVAATTVTIRKVDQTVSHFNLATLPLIDTNMADLDKTMVQTRGTMEGLNGSAHHVNHMLAWADDKLTKPKGRLATIGHFAVGFLESVAADVVAFKLSGF